MYADNSVQYSCDVTLSQAEQDCARVLEPKEWLHNMEAGVLQSIAWVLSERISLYDERWLASDINDNE